MHKYIYIYILSTVKWYEGRTTQISKGRKKKWREIEIMASRIFFFKEAKAYRKTFLIIFYTHASNRTI